MFAKQKGALLATRDVLWSAVGFLDDDQLNNCDLVSECLITTESPVIVTRADPTREPHRQSTAPDDLISSTSSRSAAIR